MQPLTATELAELIGGKLLSGEPLAELSSVSTDSRTLRAGDLFFALSGPNFDAHNFLTDARAKGAAGAVVSRDVFSDPLFEAARAALVGWPLVLVQDPLAALGRLASWHRRRLSARIVGLTGSVGKTTTKELIAHLLSGSLSGVKAPKSFNNAIGVPLTLLQLQEADRFGVIEIGTNAFGEVAALAAIARPDIGLITCVGDAHLERFGSRWGVAWEKGHLIAALPADGVAVLNADDPWSRRIAPLARGRVVTFGFSRRAEVRIESFEESDGGMRLLIGGQSFSLKMLGRHNAMNAAAAIAVARQFGLSLSELADRARSFRLPPMRMQPLRFGSVTVIADEYNANPTSVAAALAEYRSWPSEGRKLFVLGDMLELGPAARRLHASVGRAIARARLDELWTVGPLAQHAARGALAHGMGRDQVHSCPSTEQACERISESIKSGDTVLLKGSRAVSLERLIRALEQRCGSPSRESEDGEVDPCPGLFESFRATPLPERVLEGAQ